jgi:hypothetical protein
MGIFISCKSISLIQPPSPWPSALSLGDIFSWLYVRSPHCLISWNNSRTSFSCKQTYSISTLFYQPPPHSYLSHVLILPPCLSPMQHAGVAVAVELGISSPATRSTVARRLPGSALHPRSNSHKSSRPPPSVSTRPDFAWPLLRFLLVPDFAWPLIRFLLVPSLNSLAASWPCQAPCARSRVPLLARPGAALGSSAHRAPLPVVLVAVRAKLLWSAVSVPASRSTWPHARPAPES